MIIAFGVMIIALGVMIITKGVMIIAKGVMINDYCNGCDDYYICRKFVYIIIDIDKIIINWRYNLRREQNKFMKTKDYCRIYKITAENENIIF